MSLRAELRRRFAALLSAGPMALLIALAPCRVQAEQTIAYEPALVTLTGTLRGGEFAHPNGQQVPFWYLRVREPVRVPADPANSINVETSGVMEIQVHPANEAMRKRLKRSVGHRITLAGTVFHEHTAWHARELVMVVSEPHAPGKP